MGGGNEGGIMNVPCIGHYQFRNDTYSRPKIPLYTPLSLPPCFPLFPPLYLLLRSLPRSLPPSFPPPICARLRPPVLSAQTGGATR